MFAIGIAYHKQFLPDIELSPNFYFSDQMPSVYLIVPQNSCLDSWLLNNTECFCLNERRKQPHTL